MAVLPSRLAPLIGVLATACAVAAAPAAALDPLQPLSRYVHQVWTTDQGLPENSVYAMVQTRDGYLWLGTDEGLVRFDGLRFTVFDRTNTPVIRDPFVFTLHEAPDGSLWAGTDRGGLIRYRAGQFSRYGTDRGLPAARIQALTTDAHGTLWVGLRGAGLARFTGDRFTVLGVKDGLASDNVLSVFADTSGTLWVGTDAGLDRFDNGRFVHVGTADGLPPGAVRAIAEDRSHHLWIGMLGGALGARTHDGALCVGTGGRFAVVSTGTDLPSIAVMAMTEDRDGNLWLGTAGGGVIRVRDGRLESWLLGETPSDDMVYALTEDREGNIWIGTQPGGLHRLRNSRFATVETRDGLTDEVIESLVQDHRGVMWIGTHAGGVCRLEAGPPTCLTTRDGLAHNRVNAMVADPDGTMWLGTEGGLNRLHDGSFARYTTADGLPIDHVNALLRSRTGDLWIGTWGGGVARMTAGTRIDRPPGASAGYVNIMYERRSGEIWIGTTEGLAIWTGGRIVNATRERGMPSGVESFYEDRDGNMWIGTRRDGLFLFKDGRLRQYTTATGLYDNLVGTLAEDDSGYLWMTCNKGIFRVSRQELLDVARGTRATVTSRAFDTDDGLKNRECDFGQGLWKAGDGRLWFATVGGAAVIDPARLATSSEPARVHIEHLLVDGDEARIDGTPTIPYGKRHIEFRFVGLSLSAPSRVRYRYRLKGFDPEWIEGGDSRVAHYTNIGAGSYRFEVVASNGDGIWNPEPASLVFAVASPVWRRPWFAVSALVLLVAAALGGAQVRVAGLRRGQALQAEFSRQLISFQENERRRLAGEIHDGIGQELLIIGNWARLALDRADPDDARSSLQTISDTASESLRQVRALTRELEPYNIDHVGLGEAVEAMLRRMGDASGVSFTTRIDAVDGALPSDGGINVYRIVQEAANNIVKHAQASSASVTIGRRAGAIRVEIADDGRGLSPSLLAGGTAEGFGLRSIAARTRLLGGTYRIESKPGAGTTIIVEIPASPSAAGTP